MVLKTGLSLSVLQKVYKATPANQCPPGECTVGLLEEKPTTVQQSSAWIAVQHNVHWQRLTVTSGKDPQGKAGCHPRFVSVFGEMQ